MKLAQDEGKSRFSEITAESRREQNLSDPSKGQVTKLGGNTPTNQPALKHNAKLNF